MMLLDGTFEIIYSTVLERLDTLLRAFGNSTKNQMLIIPIKVNLIGLNFMEKITYINAKYIKKQKPNKALA